MSTPQEMYQALPPFTRGWLTAAFVTTALTSVGTLDASKLIFYLPFVYEKFELWRLVTNFIFFGPFSFPFLIQMFVLGRFSSAMEADPFKTSYAGGTADYVFSIIVMGGICLVIAWAMEYILMGQSLSFAILYLWSKRNPEAPTNIWGFSFKGAQLPWALMAFSVLTGSSPVMYLVGVFVGHCYYFLVEVLPLSQDKTYLTTPDWLIRLVANATGQGFAPARPGAPGPAAAPGRHNWGGGGNRLGGN